MGEEAFGNFQENDQQWPLDDHLPHMPVTTDGPAGKVHVDPVQIWLKSVNGFGRY